jgi:uncharacterized protein
VPLIALQWSFIFAGALLLLWAPAQRWLAAGSLVIGYALAFGNGQLDAIAFVPVLLLVGAASGLASQQKVPVLILAHLSFVLLALALFLHWLPGFHNQRVIGPERLTPDAVPYSISLNLDAPLIGFCLLLLARPHMRQAEQRRTWLNVGVIVGSPTIVACLGVAALMGFGSWAPKWPDWGWLWIANNLALSTLAEEAFFRGYVQGGLERQLAAFRQGQWIALCVAALIFGLAHLAGGWKLVILAGLAGLGYGIAYRHGGLQAAVLTHFGLNLIHLGVFTYPMLAR